MVLLGVLAGLWWIKHDAPRHRLDPEDAASLAVEVFLAGLIGSRLQFVIHNWEAYAETGWWNVFAIWKGGLVWYGGFLAAVPVAVWRMRHYGFPVLRTCDLLAPATMLGLAIGRIGCLMAGDDHGRIIILRSNLQNFLADKPPGWLAQHNPYIVDAAEIPWYALTFTDERALVGEGYRDLPLLPSQPLMTIGCLVVFGILVALRKPLMKAAGSLSALLFVLYPIERYLVEMTRGDQVRGYIPDSVPLINGMSVSQGISALVLPFAILAFAILYVRGRREHDRLLAEGKDPFAVEKPIRMDGKGDAPPSAPPTTTEPPTPTTPPDSPPPMAPAYGAPPRQP
jgi:phosphatidylglycerol:prolipoprotein diacylglycerol transferase